MFIFEQLRHHKLQTNTELTLFGILIIVVIIFFVIGAIWSIYNIVIKHTKNKEHKQKSGYCPKQCRIKTVKELMYEQYNTEISKRKVEPVQYGRWEWVDGSPDNYDLKCTVCDGVQDSGFWKRCPYCGAKMKNGE